MQGQAAPWNLAAADLVDPIPDPYLHDPAGWVRDRTGEHIWSRQVALMESVRDHRRTAVPACHGPGKCLSLDATVQLADGTVTRAGDLVGRCFVLPTWDESGAQTPGIAWATDNGRELVYQVTTKGGRSIDRTGNHPLWVGTRHGGGAGRRIKVESHGWRDVDRVNVGDLVLVPETIQVEGQVRQPEDDVKFAAYMLGDGGTTIHVAFTQEEGPAKDEFRRIVTDYGCQLREHPRNKYGILVVGPDDEQFGNKGSNPARERLRAWSMMGKKATQKRFPDWVWRLPNDQLALFLNRLFACDGWACTPNRKPGDRQGGNVQIGIGLASEGMLRDVELAMLRLGIVGTVNARTTSYTGSDKRFKAWVWSTIRLEALQRFRDVIGIYGKEDAVARTVEAKASFRGRPSRWMRSEAPPGYRWEEVTSVKHLGEQPTVCVSVPEKHAFVTTFVEHNSHISGRAVLWWLDIHPPGTAFVVTSAPTAKQVHAILWREIGRAHQLSGMDGRVLQNDELQLGGELVAFGRKPADHDQHAFQGIHALYILVVFDEACGIPLQLWTAASTLITNEHARWLAVGNPDDPKAEFAKVCEGADRVEGGLSARGWNVLPISAFHTPAVTGEAVPEELAMNLTSRLWMEEFAQDVGGPALVDAHRVLLGKVDAGASLDDAYRGLEDKTREVIDGSPLYVAKVLGWFPGDTTDGVVLWSWLKQCTLPQDNAEAEAEPVGPVELGIDVGGSETGDETVIYERVGHQAGRRWSIRSSDPNTVTDLCLEAIDEVGPSAVKIDSIGIGWGIMGSLRRERPSLSVVGVNVSQRARARRRFLNLRSELWWDVARGLSKDQAWDLSGLAEESTLAELAAPLWSEDRNGRVKVESKEDIRKRLGRSTDNADALLLAFYQGGRQVAHTPAQTEARRPSAAASRYARQLAKHRGS